MLPRYDIINLKEKYLDIFISQQLTCISDKVAMQLAPSQQATHSNIMPGRF